MTDLAERRRERRSRPRLPQSLQITFREAKSGAERSLVAKVEDFSRGGIGLEMFVPLQAGTLVTLAGDLRSDDLALAIEGRARVVHSRRLPDGNYRVGLSLEEMALRKTA